MCTKFDDFLANAKKILADYKLRGYPNETLQEALKSLDSTVLLILKDDQPDKIFSDLFLVMIYSLANPEVKKALEDNWHLIKQEGTLSPLHDTTVKIGFRRPLNLQDLLVSARLNGPTKSFAQTSGKINNPCF